MSQVNDSSARGELPPQRIGGWLLVLCMLLVVWGPIQFGVVASAALAALPVRGLSLGLVLITRVAVAAIGVAAGIALLTRQGPALSLAKTSLVLSAATDVFVYATPYFPGNRMPGDEVFYVIGTLAYSVGWLVYLARSARVRNTYS